MVSVFAGHSEALNLSFSERSVDVRPGARRETASDEERGCYLGFTRTRHAFTSSFAAPRALWPQRAVRYAPALRGMRLSSTNPPRSTIMTTEIFTPGAVYTLFNGHFGTVMEFCPSNGLVQAGTHSFANKSCQQASRSHRIPLFGLSDHDLILDF